MTTTTKPTRPGPTRAELESSLEAYFAHAVRTAGGLAYKLAPTVKGMPDRMVLFPGGLIRLVELKAHGGTVAPMQAHWHEQAAALGTNVAVLTGRADIDHWITHRYDALEHLFPNKSRRSERSLRRAAQGTEQ